MKMLKITLLLFFYCLSIQHALANLLISPQRIFFEPRDRVQEIVLLNSGNEELTYRVEWIELMQTENGGYADIAPKDENTLVKKASDHIRFSPRQVRLKPGESQKIKFVARRKPNMTKGEYRSHVRFAALPRSPIEKHAEGEMAFDLQVLTSFSVPLILREGEGESTFRINSVEVKPNDQDSSQYGDIKVNWSKVGEFSAVGQLKAEFKPYGSSEFRRVGFLNGVNFFSETNMLTTNIIWEDAAPTANGTLKISFLDQYTNEGKVLAESELDFLLPNENE